MQNLALFCVDPTVKNETQRMKYVCTGNLQWFSQHAFQVISPHKARGPLIDEGDVIVHEVVK